jgi:hypothetical protein
MLIVAELRYPGRWIENDLSPEDNSTVTLLLFHLECSVADAALSLGMYQDAPRQSDRIDHDKYDRDQERRMALRERHGYDAPPPMISGPDRIDLWREWQKERDRIGERVDRELAREDWAVGEIPDSYIRRLPLLHAKSFLYALDNIGKVLLKVANVSRVPSAVRGIPSDWDEAFPDLVHIRDTAHHPEDRLRGKGKFDKALPSVPMDNQLALAPNGGVLVYDALNGDSYGGTLADGRYADVDITFENLEKARILVQRTIDAFDWQGPARLIP